MFVQFSVSELQSKSQNQNDTIVNLSEHARIRLEELMMEGDLLEITLSETSHIWLILSHTSNGNGVRKYGNLKDNQSNNSVVDGKDVKKRGRKRKSDDFGETKNPVGRPKLDEKTLMKRRSLNNKTENNKPTGQIKRGPRKV